MSNKTPDYYSDLIARLEKATGPDRELDRDILVAALGWRRGSHILFAPDGSTYPDHPGGMYPSPTESLDAALTLVPEGCSWLVNVARRDLCWARCFPESNDPNIEEWGVEAIDITSGPAIALCIAALKARQAGG